MVSAKVFVTKQLQRIAQNKDVLKTCTERHCEIHV